MGLVISSYLADKYLVGVKDIEKSSDWFFNKSEEASSSNSGEFKYIVFFDKTIIGYLTTPEEVIKAIEDVRSKIFRQFGFSSEYISYWREITNNESDIEQLKNGDVVFNSHFIQRNRNYIVSYENILYRFKIIKAECLSNFVKSE